MKASFVFNTYLRKLLYLRGHHAYKVHPRALNTCTDRSTPKHILHRTECMRIAGGANVASRELLSGKSVLSEN